ncbi:sugar ABC transporter ATP-binding protein [Acerihabitans arboris]|uniref:ATP-binding cassette domain-containing protein n=1 Tax=Acerihabitans arboris TaxID=2691583 RepID=A0A845SF57_9GAMM|nr:sugar ABC transporter ATP-binding protein [Acerihabitans arboris]NDL61574.1 ATP-binding cassette domain-containing protein [Acerihabitans arboris]
MSEALLTMKHVTKRFPGVLALDNVNFDLNRGEVHALLGENGAGKSTLMKILSGVYSCDEGQIVLEGRPVTISSPIQAGALGIAIIHQEFNLFPDLTVEQNIYIGREYHKRHKWILDETAQRQAVLDILAMLNLNIDPTRRISQLTVAQQQMVEIAKALSVNAKILIMDEPTAALTESEIDSLFKVIELLKSQGVAIVYISHRLEELALIADRATVMRDGKYIATVDYTRVRIEQLIAMMVGRDLGDIYPARAATPGDEVVLGVRNLGRRGVLSDITFELRKGEILGIAGLMGAGRTEVARALFGADPMDCGEISLSGRDVTINSVHGAIALGIGYLTEDRKKDGLALGLSVGTNIMLSSYRQYANRWGIIDDKRCNSVSESLRRQLRIKTPDLEQLAVNLSGGNQQKIIIAKWLCKNSEILIFDEPTRGIDVGAKLEIYDLMNQLTAEGKSIIMISSELPEILGMCDRILIMRQGRITAELSSAQANQENIMKYATLEG